MFESDYKPDRIGRYDILTRLAVGGMAEIFLAVEHGVAGLERTVVIKRILPQFARQPSFVEMFLREARIAARLNHPNVVQIYELGETHDSYFIAMEYIHGSTARELQLLAEEEHSRLTCGAALSIVVQACRGLHAAHELTDREGKPLGLVHRDVNPHNLMLTEEGHVKLLDFGIVKATAGLERTYSGALKGKFSYLSPEQAGRKPLDRRSDVFALGIVLWELLTGKRLFKRPTEMEMIQAVLDTDAPPPTDIRPDIPGPIVEALAHALARDREIRHGSAEDFRVALVDAARESDLDVSADTLAALVRDVAGDQLALRRVTLQDAMERTLGSEERERLLHAEATFTTSGDEDDVLYVSYDRSDDEDTVVRRPTVSTEVVAAPDDPPNEPQPPRWIRLAVVGLLALVLAAVALLLPPSQDGRGDTEGSGGEEATFPGPALVIGWAPYADRHLTLEGMDPFENYLEAQLQWQVEFIVADDYADNAARLISGDIAFAILPPLLYVRTKLDHPDIELLAIKEFDGTVGYDGWLVVRDDAPHRELHDLRGLTFCFTDENSTSGYFLPRAHLVEQGYDLDEFIGEVHWSGQHLQGIRDLLAGLCDVLATYHGAVLTADETGISAGRVRVVEVTGRIPQDAVVAGADVPQEVRETLRQALLDFDPQVEFGESRVGRVHRLTGFSAGTDDDFAELRRAVQAMQ